MTEQELIDQLSEADQEYKEATKLLVSAKKTLVAAETKVINCKIYKERLVEELRVYRNTTIKHDPSLRDKEIQAFRDSHSELCAEAFARDMAKRGVRN